MATKELVNVRISQNELDNKNDPVFVFPQSLSLLIEKFMRFFIAQNCSHGKAKTLFSLFRQSVKVKDFQADNLKYFPNILCKIILEMK